MSAEEKLRFLAAADSTLQGYLQTPGGSFRWFDVPLPQGQLKYGPCITVQRISTGFTHLMQGTSSLTKPLLQIDVIDYDGVLTRQLAKVIRSFFSRISLAQSSQFGSPITTPPQFPNFVLNQREGVKPQLQPPARVQSIDVRVYDEEAL